MLDWFLLFLQIMLINIVLSGDNAVVIALASKNLPIHQRKQAIWWGAFGAIGLRLVLTVVAVYLLTVPYIQAAGSLLLLWIAVKLLADDDSHANVKQASSLGKAIWTIIVADLVMSLDNVLAIAAKAQGDISVIILGIGLSIPIIIWGSTLVMNLLHKFPILVYAGAGILGYTAGEMFVSDEKMQDYVLHHNGTAHWSIPVITTVIVIAAGFLWKRAQTTGKPA
ncbi:TerC family protein [Paenibacillus hemerocallicola]|jgi:YjbE family integral membrane protein|uniref:TerC family protein n=1 Tax=Paenibacillus hemerocallicola TaxID=1172614 RepID=A0A5C4T799_9BACL|nr:TerC family protein [Paenibacillus hemerocallicola]TNJ64159.1 TerC family protein [Paenibacillus hemerocallicola]